ncbi:MAG TPA: hypothetical protein VK419_14640, partial [Bryobacteraceae bacterium]|nr:hypothetical protein [Bryobacteraceae bacterium]
VGARIPQKTASTGVAALAANPPAQASAPIRLVPLPHALYLNSELQRLFWPNVPGVPAMPRRPAWSPQSGNNFAAGGVMQTSPITVSSDR